MGKWTLERLSGRFSPLNTGTNFGHNFYANYRLRYTPTTFDTWTDTPRLDWHERVIKLDYTTRRWHEYELNYYLVKPQSATLLIWSKRYIEAYNKANGTPDPLLKGSSQLLDKRGNPVPVATLGLNKPNNEKKADAVRSYLKKHGGILCIEVHDVPSISLPLAPNEHIERFLMFNVGIVDDDSKIKAEQHLKVNQTTMPATWSQIFNLDWKAQWATRGLTKEPPPANLVTPMPPGFMAGEYW